MEPDGPRSPGGLKIVHAVPDFSASATGGAQRHVYDIASEASLRHDVAVVTWVGGEDPGSALEEKMGRVRVRRLVLNDFPSGVLETRSEQVERSFAAVLSELRPDIVHLHQLAGLSAELVVIAGGLARAVVVTLHDYLSICPTCTIHWRGRECFNPGIRCWSCLRPDPFSRKRSLGYWVLTNPPHALWGLATGNGTAAGRFARLLMRRKDIFFAALRKADRLIAPSEALADVYVRSGLDRSLITVIPHGIRAPDVSAAREAGGPVRIGFIGSHRVKGLRLLLKAFRNIPAGQAVLLAYTQLHRFEPAERRRIRRLADHPSVRIMGGFDPAEADACYAAFDVLAAPSVWVEPFGLVAAEAVARGVPVIAADSCGLEETVRHEVNGLLFRRGDQRSLEAALRRCISEPGLLERLRQGCGTVKSAAEQAVEIEAVYESCLDRAEARV